MATVLVTGSCGVVGGEAVRYFAGRGFHVLGVDNDLRGSVLGPAASTLATRARLRDDFPGRYQHHHLDVCDRPAIENLFREFAADIDLVLHAAAPPAGFGEGRDPHADFGGNAGGTLVLLEALRRFTPQAVFLFLSGAEVYGDRPNRLALVECDTRWEVADAGYFDGVDETFGLDRARRSVAGAGKVAADLLAQEYGQSFGLRTMVLRCGRLVGAGPTPAGANLLADVLRCVAAGEPYLIRGQTSKQVRDYLHATDLLRALERCYRSPRPGEVYNLGGGRPASCSVLEAIERCEEVCGRVAKVRVAEEAPSAEPRWYVSDSSKFQAHYPGWAPTLDLDALLASLHEPSTLRRAA